MRYLVTGSQMKAIDSYTISQVGIPALVLQERAALCVADAVKEAWAETGIGTHPSDAIWAVCGSGNNGADGIAAARILHNQGYPVHIVLAGDQGRGTEEFYAQKRIAETLGVPMTVWQPEQREDWSRLASGSAAGTCRVLVDAVFGVGLSRPVEGSLRDVIDRMNQVQAETVIAVDLPSGIHSDNGQVMGAAVRADVTITFGYEKLGTALYPGRSYAGRVTVCDIGFSGPEFWRKDGEKPGIHGERLAVTCDETDLFRAPMRPEYSNKGTFGKILVVAGCETMGGAAYLSALAAYRMGAGLVKIMTVPENSAMATQRLPEAMLTWYSPEEILQTPEQVPRRVEAECAWADVIVLGPGIGKGPETERLVREFLMNSYVPMVLDADGLNAVARHPGLTQYFTENIIITPHPGEMSRLINMPVEQLKEDLIAAASSYSGLHGITCVLKDAATVTAGRDGQCSVNESGNSCMAKAGSGDVLTGILAGLLAQGVEMWEAASLGVFIHGLAGDRLREKNGAYGMLARELADEAAQVMGEIDPIRQGGM